jgi:hypothetical protein
MQKDQRPNKLEEAIRRYKEIAEAARKAAEEAQKKREQKESYPR